MQVSRKFEQMDTEALLLRAGAKDPEAARDFKAEASLPSSVPAPEDTAATSNQPAPEAVGKHKSLLEQAVNAKPFVPRNGHEDAEEVRALTTGILFCSGTSLHLVDLASLASCCDSSACDAQHVCVGANGGTSNGAGKHVTCRVIQQRASSEGCGQASRPVQQGGGGGVCSCPRCALVCRA